MSFRHFQFLALTDSVFIWNSKIKTILIEDHLGTFCANYFQIRSGISDKKTFDVFPILV